MRLTYADREMVMRVLDAMKADAPSDDSELLQQVAQWAKRLRPAVGYESALLRDVTALSHYLATLDHDDLKEVARAALAYAVRTNDLVPDDTPLLGLQDDAYVAAFTVHEIRMRLGEPTNYSPPRLTSAERELAERMFNSFLTQPLASDEQLISEADGFCRRMGAFADSGFFGRLCRNIHYLCNRLKRKDQSSQDLAITRAALSYLNCEADAVADRLGLIGYLDDNFVIQTAIDIIEPGRDPWLNLLDAVAEVWPFINHLVLQQDSVSYPISEFLIINSALSCPDLAPQGRGSRAALVLPRVGPTPLLLSFVAGLGLVQELCRRGNTDLTFQPGQRVIIDNNNRLVATFAGFETINGRQMFRLQQRGSAARLWPVRDLVRLTPVGEHRVPRGQLRFDQATTDSPVSALEQLFFTDAPIQFGKLDKRIVLVTAVGQARERACEYSLLGQKLVEILPIGNLRPDSDFEMWSSRFGATEPVIAVVPDLDKARELVEDDENTALVIVDAPLARKSAALAAIAGKGIPVLALSAEADSESLDVLMEQAFQFWDWDASDIRQLFWPEPDSRRKPPEVYEFERRVVAVHREDPTVWTIPFPAADAAFAAVGRLQKLAKARGAEDSLADLDDAVTAAYDVLFMSLQSLKAANGEADAAQLERLKVLDRVQSSCWFLTAEERAAASDAHAALLDVVRRLDRENAKADTVAELLKEYPRATVICRDAAAAAGLRQQYGQVTTMTCARVDGDIAGGVIIPGWFGRQKMQRLLVPPVSLPATLVLYDLENAWYEGLKVYRGRARARRAAHSPRQKFFKALPSTGGRETAAPIVLPTGGGTGALDTLEDYQRTVVENRRSRVLDQARPEAAEPSVEGWPVFFADGSHAFLTEAFQAKVVTHLMDSRSNSGREPEVQLLGVDRLRVGDVLLFLRGSSRDVIREVADRLLPSGTRRTALLWQDALRRYAKSNALTADAVWRRLRDGGCTHHRSTVQYWLESDDIIAPRDAHDHELKLIADVTRDSVLTSQLLQCDRAISDVWGAHLRASHHLAQQVVARTAGYLAIGAEMNELVEVEPGVLLARIEEVQPSPVLVKRSLANRLLEGQLWRG